MIFNPVIAGGGIESGVCDFECYVVRVPCKCLCGRLRCKRELGRPGN